MARVALIGVGHWHMEMHVRGLRAAGVDLVSVSDPDPAAADRWARELDCPVYERVDDQLAAGCDLAWAMPRHADAADLAERLVAHRIPFAIEKPLGLRATEIAPLVPLAAEAGLFAAVALINRYGGFWEEVERLRGEGELGALVHGSFRVVNGDPSRYVHDGVGWMLDPAVSGGGPLRNLGSHGADAICSLSSGEPEVLAAATSSTLYSGQVEDYAVALVRGAQGALFTLEAGYTHSSMQASDQEFRLAGDGGYVIERIDELVVATRAGERVRRTLSIPERYVRFATDTIERWRSGLPPRAGIEDCHRAMSLVDRVYAAAGSPLVAR